MDQGYKGEIEAIIFIGIQATVADRDFPHHVVNHRQRGDREKPGEIVEVVQNQKDGRQIAPSRSPLKDLSVYGEVGDPTSVSDGYGKSDAHLPRFFSVS